MRQIRNDCRRHGRKFACCVTEVQLDWLKEISLSLCSSVLLHSGSSLVGSSGSFEMFLFWFSCRAKITFHFALIGFGQFNNSIH